MRWPVVGVHRRVKHGEALVATGPTAAGLEAFLALDAVRAQETRGDDGGRGRRQIGWRTHDGVPPGERKQGMGLLGALRHGSQLTAGERHWR